MAPSVVRSSIELAGLRVPLVEVNGAEDGPLLTVIAGVHGCEYASMSGVRRWLAGLQAREIRGRVRAVPVLNVTAFAAPTPFVVPEDGKNLNRCFPGDPAGSLADRLAYDAFTQLITGSDAYIDAHCGDLVEELQPFALYEAGLHAVPGQLGMADAQPTVPARTGQTLLGRFLWLRCARAGWWAPVVRAGDAVTAGQVIGTVSTLDGGAILEEIVAPADGVVIFLTSSPAVAGDGLLLGLGAS